MKKILFSVVLLSFCISVFGQRAKIRKKRIKVEYATLPKHKVEKSTYQIDIAGLESYTLDEEAINLRGWEKVDGDADVKVKVKVNGFRNGKPKKQSKSTSTTDKKTKKKTTTTNYWYEVSSSGRASMAIYGPVNAYAPPSNKKAKKKTKKRKPEKEEKKETNRFLKDVAIDEAPKEEDEGTAGVAGNYNLGKTYEYKTAKHRSSSNAYKEYQNKGGNHAADSEEHFYNNLAGRISYQLNDFYGYNRKTEWVVFKRLKSKKHPEYQIFNEATDGIKAIFAQKRFNMNNDQIAEALAPIMEYFEGVAGKYSKDDKNHKRIKSAAMYNMAQAYLYLDMPDKVIDIAKNYQRWGHDSKIGEDFERKANNLNHLLAFHGVDGRYYVTEEDADDVWTEDIGDEPVEDEN